MTKKSDVSTTVEKNKETVVKQIESLRDKLEREISNFTHKSQLIHHRQKFLETKSELEKFINDQGTDFDEFLNDSGKKIVFKDDSSYGRDGLGITNNLLVREFAECLLKRIDEKVAAIEREIIN